MHYKIILPAFIIGLAALFFLGWQETVSAEIVHQDLQARLMLKEQEIQVQARITLPEARHKQLFYLNPKGRIQEVALDGLRLDYSFEHGRLSVILPESAAGDKVTVAVSYSLVMDDDVPDSPMHTEDPSYGISGAITEKGAFLSPGSGWYPDLRAGPAFWNLDLKAPPGFLAVTAGKLHGHETADEYSRSVWETKIPLPGLTVSVGPYEVHTKMAGEIPVSTYFFPESRELVSGYLEACINHLQFYEELLGPYPFEKFAVVENFFPTGYGFPSWTLIGSMVIRLPFIKQTSLPHEIAHSWWGNGVRVDYRQGNWSEAVTTYVADYLLLELESEQEAQDYRQRLLRNYSSLITREKDFPLTRFLRRDSRESQTIGYGKGAMVFHMLRLEVGEQQFWEGLRRMASEYMLQEAGWHDFQKVFSQEAQRDMEPFFNQWVQKPGAPRLELKEARKSFQDGNWIVNAVISQSGPFFEFNLPVLLETEGESIETLVRVSEEKTYVELKSRYRPLELKIDPYSHIFRRLHPGEIPPIVERLRGSDSLVAVLSSDLLPEEQEAAALLLMAMNRADVEVLREDEVRNLEKKDVLFLGLPREYARHFFDQQSKFVYEDEKIFLDQKPVLNPGSALFAVVNPDADPDRIWALFAPGSKNAARDTVRRIPHYGRYSWILFQDGEQTDKGVLEPLNSPLHQSFQPRETGLPEHDIP